MRQVILAFVGETAHRPTALLALREYARPSAAFPVVYEGVVAPLHKAVAAIVGAADERPADEPAVILRAHALLGQCLGFAIARPIVCRRLGWSDYTPERIEQVVEVATATALRALDLPQPAAD